LGGGGGLPENVGFSVGVLTKNWSKKITIPPVHLKSHKGGKKGKRGFFGGKKGVVFLNKRGKTRPI